MSPVASAVKNIRASVSRRSREQQDQQTKPEIYIPTGSTLLNLALSDRPNGGYAAGKVVNLIGDSSSGKSMLAFSCFAEAAMRSRFDEYELIYDDAEAACDFDVPKLFGAQTAARVRSPRPNGQCSLTVQDFYANVRHLTRKQKKFIYVLDSFDGVSSIEEIARMDEMVKAIDNGKEVRGSYKMEKPKVLSEMLRNIVADLESTDSLLIIISQTRDVLNPMSYETKTRAGGRALKFFSSYEYWLTIKQRLKAHDRTVGALVEAKVRKNKKTGKWRDATFALYYDYGLDDLGSCIDFLVDQGYWQMDGQKIHARGLGIKASRKKLIEVIEQDKLEKDLRRVTGEAWLEVEEKLKLGRKPKYV